MAEKFGFFNAANVNGVYDRTYNADDYSENLAVIISNGVLRSTGDDLKVTASGLRPVIAPGRAWINGKWYNNTETYTLNAVPLAPAGSTRVDRIVLRMDKGPGIRTVQIRRLAGPGGNVKPELTRNETIYEICLAEYTVGSTTTTLSITDTRSDADLCGWVYSTSGDGSFFTTLDNEFNTWFDSTRDSLASVTLFTRYNWRRVLTSAAQTVQFNVAQYDAETCFIEVYVNGILETETADYTLNNNIITFAGTLVAGTEIEVKVFKSIDGTGINSVTDEITELQNQVAALEGISDFVYNCTGLNDNLSLSQIAQALYTGSYVAANVTPAAADFLTKIGGSAYLSAMPADAQITINVVGSLAATTAFAGTGTTADRYKWFKLGSDTTTEKRVIFDFAHCAGVNITCGENTDNIIFYGTEQYIKNVNAFARCNLVGCLIQMVGGLYNYGNIEFENCKLKIVTTSKSIIAENGTFTNCNTYNSSANDHALNFVPTTDALIRVTGGNHYAYTARSAASFISAIFYTYATASSAVILATDINCPVKAVNNFYQKNLSIAFAGSTHIKGIVSTLTNAGDYNNVSDSVWRSKTR